ncbi:cysteine proteinase [Rickenella mellea]|uniref:Ubiquitin carboxyl-terminal hydrolase n=1 Tax=Rickenella mellea TaxID=50990 RepID=A0A4Y7QFE4_9AGAM|nr:cysteine proteinase [Rickenella mellea]
METDDTLNLSQTREAATVSGCEHLTDALTNDTTKASMLKKFKAAVAWSALNLPKSGRQTAKRRKISMPTCGTCGLTLVRPFICLDCPFGGCWHGGHIVDHLKEAKHRFCADVKSGSVFCSKCDDFIYNRAVEDLFHSVTLSAEEKETKFQRREPYKPWIPDAKESAALDGMIALACHGRRGLLNLGQTCFLNVILQALLHNPLLRNFFLSDRHNCKLCKTKDCMSCEMDKLFAEIFSGDSAPYGPVTLLATTWRASELAGYAQQDAHEFFIFVLNQIHASSRGSTEVSCNCIIHNVFAGQLQSDVRCDKCGNVASTVDPLLDVSLELKGKGGELAENTLAGCLRRYTQQEKLTSKYNCESCGVTSNATAKRLTIRKLPPVLSFQLKATAYLRFEHKSRDKSSTAKKIGAHIRFPATLNMAPYTTLIAGMQNKENESGRGHEPNAGPEMLYEYDLFAVINHEGQIDNGHYTNFTRSQDEWYRFDDDKVTHSTLDAALKSDAYMCFYAKRHLDYKPYTRPSYVAAREAEAVKEKEKEREMEAARMKEVEDALLATV